MQELGMNGKAKDTVFRDVFSNPRYTLQLYKVFHPEDTETTIDDIKNVTINNILTTDIYNDLGFMVGERIIIMTEAQSTWSVNIITRLILYFAETVKRKIIDEDIDIYRSKLVHIPKPEFYVVYCGRKPDDVKNEYFTFSGDIMEGQNSSVEVTVKIIKDESKDNILGQYLEFTRILYRNFDKYGKTRRAIEETVRTCLDENLLKEYMSERKREVVDMMSLIFSQEEVDAIRDRNHIKIGKAKSLVEDIENLSHEMNITIPEACRLLKKTEADYDAAKELLKDEKIAV